MSFPRLASYLFTFVVVAAAVAINRGCRPNPEWTVMLYMNGDNDLEGAALRDFEELAKVDTRGRINVVVQLDRGTAPYMDSQRYDDWTGARRYEVKLGTVPDKNSSKQDLGSVNMGDPNVLRDFVMWAQTNYPAKKYMLVLWNHGQGWRLLKAKLRERFRAPPLPISTAKELATLMKKEASDIPPEVLTGLAHASKAWPVIGGHEKNDPLYSQEIVEALRRLPSGRRIDVLEFDACRMAMLETAYDVRHVARFMVASEDYADADFWSQASWLSKLAEDPLMSPRVLSRTLVETYAADHAKQQGWTLSAIDLDRVDRLAGAVSDLGEALRADLLREWAAIQAARGRCLPYDLYVNGVDVGFFCEQLLLDHLAGAPSVKDERVRRMAERARDALKPACIAAKSDPNQLPGFGGTGLAVFFPDTLDNFNKAPERHAYLEANQQYALEFVRDGHWDDFLREYLILGELPP